MKRKERDGTSEESSDPLPRSVIQIRVGRTDKGIWEHCCADGKLSEWFRSLGRAHLVTAVRATEGTYVRLTGQPAVDCWTLLSVAFDTAIYDQEGDRVDDPYDGDYEFANLHTYVEIDGGIGGELWGIMKVEGCSQSENEAEYRDIGVLGEILWAANSASEAAYTYGLATGTKQYRVYSLKTMAGGELDEKIPDEEVGLHLTAYGKKMRMKALK
jgi:hypothetical protein